MSVDGDSRPPSRESQIRVRLAELRAEIDLLLGELRGDRDEEDSPEKRRAAFELLKGGLILVLIAASLGMASAAGWAARHTRTIAAATVTVGAAGVIAGALLAHGSPVPRSHAGIPSTRAVPSALPAPGVKVVKPASTAVPKPSHTPRVPTVPVLLPTRRRPPVA